MPVNMPAPTPVTTRGTEINHASLCIWFFHDQRPGHLKQLQGLASRLQAHARVDIIWLDIAKYRLSIRHLFKPTKALNKLPKPNIVIGAGHQTHFSVLLAAHHFKAFSTLIMKPSLPLGWFDAIICPEHDQVAASANVLRTLGPLNSVTPPISSEHANERTEHLILIGGPSKHYQFESAALLVQIQQLCQENPETQWMLSNSPRTPTGFLTQVKALNLLNLALHDYTQSSLPPLDSLLTQSKLVWLTPDSMSMIFEALTAGARVGLFDGTPQAGKPSSRIVKQIHTLLADKIVSPFSQRSKITENKNSTQASVWETDRAARWLLDRYTMTAKTSAASEKSSISETLPSSALRILQLLPGMVSGGVERGTLDLSRYLIGQGHEVWVCSSGGPLVENLKQIGAKHIQLPVNSKNPLKIWRNSRRLIQLHKTCHFDLLHVRSRAPAWSVFLARKELNIPIISTFHGQYGHHSKLKRFYNQVMLKSDVCIAVSEFIEQHIRDTYPDHRCKLQLIRRGIDLELFSNRQSQQDSVQLLREKWEIAANQKVIILPGRLTRLKGHQIFLDALVKLKQELETQSIRCLIVGDEPGKDNYRQELDAHITSHQLSGLVQLTGTCYDMPAMYALADIVISASTKPEAFGRTACEAQAMGCLVVATRHGGSLETVAPAQRQFMCEQGNSSSMAHAIRQALAMLEDAQKDRFNMIIQEAQNYIQRQFSLQQMCRETEQLYLDYTEKPTLTRPFSGEGIMS